MIISPRSSHSFRILVVRDDVVVIREFFVADGAYPGLLDESFGSAVSASRPVTAVPDILAGDVDLRPAEFRVLSTSAWGGVPGRSTKLTCGSDTIRWNGVSWTSLLVGWADFGDWLQLKQVATNASELRFLPRFAHFIHRYFVSTLRIALTAMIQLFSLFCVDG